MSKELQSSNEKAVPHDNGHGAPIERAKGLSTSREAAARRNIIKLNTQENKVKIVDYRTLLEEIQADKKREIRVELSEWVSSGKSQMGNGSDGESNGIHGNGSQNTPAAQRQSALDEAFKEGFETGKTEAAKILRPEYEARVQNIIKDLSSIIREFSKEVEKYNEEFDGAVVKLALAIAKRIVARDIEIDEGAVLVRSREAIRKVVGVDKVKILVNSSDEEYIREHRNELMSYADSVKEIAIEGDNKVERGGCIIESDLGNIDARISTQFEIVEEALLSLTK